MLTKIMVALTAIIFILVQPMIEVNDSHVFSPLWNAHARLHNVWELFSNAMFCVLALWLAWREGTQRIAAAVAFVIPGSFLIAYSLRGTYGGSLEYADRAEILLFGFNPVLGIVIFLAAGLAYCAITAKGTNKAAA